MMSIADAASVLNARTIPPLGSPAFRAVAERTLSAVSSDSRTIERGELFVALRGDRYDGHAFLDAAWARGAAAALIDEKCAHFLPAAADSGFPLVVVGDTRHALGELATAWRARFAIPLIAIAGSNGKTTVKEMTAAILRSRYGERATLATRGNLNNDIGVPLTLLRLDVGHRVAVIELGMNHPGETRELAAITHPTVALVNNAQREHQEYMTSVEAVAREHGSLFSSLPAGGIAVINADDDYANYWRGLARAAGAVVRDFSLDRSEGTRASLRGRYRPTPSGSELELLCAEGSVSLVLPLIGEHNARNALAAAASAMAAGARLEDVARALSNFAPVVGRLQMKSGRRGCTVIDDTYNANPDSVRAAIDALVLAAPEAKRFLVLGDMGEVGAQGPEFHHEIGGHARSRGVGMLFAIGPLGRHAVSAFGAGGRHFDSLDDLRAALGEQDLSGSVVLVKGSRFMRMERVVETLTGEEA